MVDPVDNLSVLGVVTLEDVIEQLLESEIYDGTSPPYSLLSFIIDVD